MFIYTAAVLSPMSATLLKWTMRAITGELELESRFKFKTPQGESLPHHMTINLGKLDTKLNPEWILGQNVKLFVDQLRWSEGIGACAYRVRDAISVIDDHLITSINDGKSSKHITTCLMPDVKAVRSNDLFGDKAEIDLGNAIQYSNLYGEILELDAVVQECQ